MQRRENQENRGICCRLVRFVVVKLMAGQKEDKSVKKKLYREQGFRVGYQNLRQAKQREDSEDNAASLINTTSRSEKERVDHVYHSYLYFFNLHHPFQSYEFLLKRSERRLRLPLNT
uniref:Uncharacterized protein n=1 Tax=Brassica oleracea var. oleracea TaxID=109376 RepID=A0A0D3DV86_BRAOL